MAGGEDRTPPGAVVIRPAEIWAKLDAVSMSLLNITNKLADVDKRLTSLERLKWIMLAIGIGGGTGARELFEKMSS